MGKECKVKYVSKDEIAQGIRKQFSPEYAEFLLVQMGYSPKVCPKCGNGSTTLWLAKPNDAINGKMWANDISGAANAFTAFVVLREVGESRGKHPISFTAMRKHWQRRCLKI